MNQSAVIVPLRHRKIVSSYPRILIIDPDIGFSFWIGQALDKEGYSAIPARNFDAAKELLTEHRCVVDLVIVDALLPGASSFISLLRSTQEIRCAVATIPEDWAEVCPMADFDILMRKPQHFTTAAKLRCVQQLSGLLTASSRPSNEDGTLAAH